MFFTFMLALLMLSLVSSASDDHLDLTSVLDRSSGKRSDSLLSDVIKLLLNGVVKENKAMKKTIEEMKTSIAELSKKSYMQINITQEELVTMKQSIADLRNLSSNRYTDIQSQIDVLKDKTDYSQEKCQSGTFGFHASPKHPAWPKTKKITFSPPFSSKPSITHGIYVLDVDKHRNTRAVVEVKKVTKKGFTLRLETFADTVLYGLRVRWMACL